MNSNGSHHFLLLMAELAHIFILDAFSFGTPGHGKNLGNLFERNQKLRLPSIDVAVPVQPWQEYLSAKL